MNRRQRFLGTMTFGSPDRPASGDYFYYDSTRERWEAEGLPKGADLNECLRLDHPEDIGGLEIPPLTQYAICVRSDTNIVVQFGRLDTTQANMAYYVGVGYCD